jgi:Tfp pilus assembly protein PilV
MANRTRASWRSRLRALRTAEGGFALIEVVVSAGLVMVIAAAVLGGIDAPSIISGRNQSSSQGAALASQDQERLRATPISTLINLNQTATKVVDAKSYTVASKVTWVTDSGSSLSCSTGDDQSGDYLKLKTTVSGASMKNPLTIESLLAPPNGSLSSSKGNLGVLITGESGQASAGIPVTLSGAGTGSGTTDANGCVFFGLLTPGQYTATIQKTGWVDPGWNNTVAKTATVSAGNTSLLTQSYALAGQLKVNVETNSYGTIAPSVMRDGVTVENGGLLPSGTKTLTTGNGFTTLTQGGVYPFTDGYSVYSGSCLASEPTPANSYSAIPTAGGAPATATVRQPAMNLTVTVLGGAYSSYSSTPPSANLESASGSTCGYRFTNVSMTTAGKFTDPGFPEDTYDLCVQGNVPSFGGTYHAIQHNVSNLNYNGTTTTFDGNAGNALSGPCPVSGY